MGTIQENKRLYGFNTDDSRYAIASQIIYSIYKSRDFERFSSKARKNYWGAVEGFVKKASRGATTVIQLIERLKKEFECKSIRVLQQKISDKLQYSILDSKGKEVIQEGDFTIDLTSIIRDIDDRSILNIILYETSYVIMLVRERIEVEKKFGVEDVSNSKEDVIDIN